MKTDLLKIIRKRYRIIENDLGETKIQERNWLFGFADLHYLIDFLIWHGNDNVHDAFIDLLRMDYSKYHRKSKIKKQKQKNWKVIWWKN